MNTIVIDVEPIFLKQPKHTQEEFTAGSSYDEGFSSEDHSFAKQEITDHNIKAKKPKGEGIESCIREDNNGGANLLGNINEEEEYKTEDDVENPNYVLYEELETEDDHYPAPEESTTKYFHMESLLKPVVSFSTF